MKLICRVLLVLTVGIASAQSGDAASDCISIPSGTSAVHFHYFTNASPDAAKLFNTFELEAFGEKLLTSPASKTALHNLLVNGTGPEVAVTNGATVIEEASGPEWRYVALDLSAAYPGRLTQFKRAILFVEPDLFVLYDHLTAKEPVDFQMVLHPPAATVLDPVWGDLHLDLPKAGLQIHAPGTKKGPRTWSRAVNDAGLTNEETVAMQLGPTNKVAKLDLITVFGVYPGGQNPGYSFKLLESNTAIGARIQRRGLPTLVAFKSDASLSNASLTGMSFNGPVGVGIFKPTRKPTTP